MILLKHTSVDDKNIPNYVIEFNSEFMTLTIRIYGICFDNIKIGVDRCCSFKQILEMVNSLDITNTVSLLSSQIIDDYNKLLLYYNEKTIFDRVKINDTFYSDLTMVISKITTKYKK